MNKNKNKIKLAAVDQQQRGNRTGSERRLGVAETDSTMHSSVPVKMKSL
jgi:hypothetical protein